MFRRIAAYLLVTMASTAAYADDEPASVPEGIYFCLQNAAITGSVWNPVECRRLADIEDQIADQTGKPVVQLDRVDPPNFVGSQDIWWKVNFKGVSNAVGGGAHWFCSDHGDGFECVWQNTENREDWLAYNGYRQLGMAEIPSAFWVSKELVSIYVRDKSVFAMRAANEAGYARAQALAKSSHFSWSYIPSEGGPCRSLALKTPFEFMEAVGAKRHHSVVEWNTSIGDEDAKFSTVASSNDTTLALKDGPVQEYRFFTSTEVCNAFLARELPAGGFKISDTDLQHKPAVGWLITDETETYVACHWPNAKTGRSPREFLNTLKHLGAKITEVSKDVTSTTDNRVSFYITFAYILAGHANLISWSDLGNFGCNPRAVDELILP